VKFDPHLRIEDPGEMKIKTFSVSRTAIAAILLGIATLALWVTQPHGSDQFKAPPLPGAYAEASSRLVMVLTAGRIDRFESARMRIPLSLDELGPVATDLVTYVRLSDSEYRLEAPGMNHALRLERSMPRNRFLGSSVDILRQNPDRAQ